MPDSPLIVAQNIHKRFGRKAVLRGVDLSVMEGHVLALLGANGAGKTTLMSIVSGLAKADRGEIRLGGVTYGHAGYELRRYIGLVSHASLLYDNLTALENMHFFARMYDIAQPERRIEAVLRAVDLWTRRRDIVRTYSRGMTQRLAIARAILHNPPVLLLDEPDTGLDQESSEMLHDLVRRLGSSNRAILLTTHNLDRAVDWADSVSILVGGRIVFNSATSQLDGDRLRHLYAGVSGER